MKVLISLAAAMLLMSASPAQSVMRSHDGTGQVAIVPVFSTVDGVDTLLKVNAAQVLDGAANNDVTAVRIQFRDSDGVALEAFNVYLAGSESWAAAVTEGPGGPELVILDQTCILGSGAGGQPAVVESGASISAAWGYVEALEMGQLRGEVPDLEPRIYGRECDALVDAFAGGVWSPDGNAWMNPPSGRLRVSASLINVERGTQYSTDPVHLRGFRDVPFHVAPADPFGLADVRDSGTPTGATRSTVCTDACTVEEWADPLDAVASTLMTTSSEADFVVDQAVRGSSVGVILNPMLAYYDAEHPAHEAVFGLLPRDSERRHISQPCIGVPPPGSICPWLPIGGSEVLNPVAVNVRENAAPPLGLVPILGVPGRFPISDEFIQFNSSLDTLTSGAVMVDHGFGPQWLTSNDGTEYFGHPSLMIMLVELVNGQLVDDQGESIRSNYGESSVASRRLRFEGAE